MSKSLIRTAAEGTLWISSSTLVVKVLGLFSIFFILRALHVEQYGILELALSIPALLSIFLLPGLDTMVIADMGAEIGRNQRARARYILFSFIRLQCVLAIVVWAILFFGATLFTKLYPVPSYYVQAVSFLFLLGPLRSAYSTMFRVQLKFFFLSSINFLEEFFKLVVVFLLFFFFELTVVGVIAAMAISQCMMILVLAAPFVQGWREISQDRNTVSEPASWWFLLKDRGVWSVLSVYAGNVGKAARLWVIQRVLGSEAVGLYAVATGLMGHTIALVPLHSVVAPILPTFAHEPGRFVGIFSKAIKYQLLAYCVVGLIGFVMFPSIVAWLFPAYASAMPLFRIMLLGLIPIAFLSVLTPAFSALKLQKSFFVSVLIKDIVSVVATYGLAVVFGLPGLAYEYVLSSVLYAVERLRRLQMHIKEVSQLRSYLFSFDDNDRLILYKASALLSKIFRR